jgi:hypothetical protein
VCGAASIIKVRLGDSHTLVWVTMRSIFRSREG